MDVDGTLTDGKIYMGVDGECMKTFDIKDGYALHTLLKENGIIPVIITARKSPMVEHRCKELGVTETRQGVMNKLDCLNGILEKYSSENQQYDLSNVAYIGDDLLDLQCMNRIKQAGGIVGCPSNAAKEVIAICDFISLNKGGDGAVRDFVEFLAAFDINNTKNNTLEERCYEIVDFLLQLHEEDLSLGRHDVNEDFYYNVIEYSTTSEENKPFESHREYVDIQMLLSGEEIMQVCDKNRLAVKEPYDHVMDRILYQPKAETSITIMKAGSIMILYPNDAHRSLSFKEASCKVRKVIGKIRCL